MSATKNTATEIIVGLAEEHLTSKIVDAAKGKTTRLSGLAKEIRNCFNIENFLAEATSAIEQLIEKKIEDALKKVDTKKSRVSKKKVVVEAPVEAEEAPVEAEAPVVEAPVVEVEEPKENRPSTPILPDSPEKDADAETETNEIPISDFIQPIGDELQEEELSEIEDDDDDEPIPLEVCDKNTKKKFYIDGSKKEINNKCFKDKDLKVSANVLCIYPDADSSQEPIFNYL